MPVNITEAKAKLSQLGELAWQGEKIVIARAGQPYLQPTPCQEESPVEKKPRQPGRLKGQIWIAPDFNETPQEIIDLFENGPVFPNPASQPFLPELCATPTHNPQ